MTNMVGVVGAGTMGTGVAIAASMSGYKVVLVDSSPSARATVSQRIRQGCQLVGLINMRNGKPSPDAAATLERIMIAEDLANFFDVDFVFECVTENVVVKQTLYRHLDEHCPARAILASNTSCIPIDRIASWSRRPERTIGTHFMNPAQVRDVLEVIRGPRTSIETVQKTQQLLATLGKSPVVVNDAPGFVINRVLMVAINEAIGVVEEGIASAAEVDALFIKCLGHRNGPLATADLIGLDVIKDSLLVLHDCFGSARYEPKRLLVEMVDQGKLGNKAGAGFFAH
jgi:3-hydroxybutyryl-CoA dehydrogenase